MLPECKKICRKIKQRPYNRSMSEKDNILEYRLASQSDEQRDESVKVVRWDRTRLNDTPREAQVINLDLYRNLLQSYKKYLSKIH